MFLQGKGQHCVHKLIGKVKQTDQSTAMSSWPLNVVRRPMSGWYNVNGLPNARAGPRRSNMLLSGHYSQGPFRLFAAEEGLFAEKWSNKNF